MRAVMEVGAMRLVGRHWRGAVWLASGVTEEEEDEDEIEDAGIGTKHAEVEMAASVKTAETGI